jgi:WD40 repeat protein
MVLGAAFSPDGKLAVTAASDKSARIWDATTDALITRLVGHVRGDADFLQP